MHNMVYGIISIEASSSRTLCFSSAGCHDAFIAFFVALIGWMSVHLCQEAVLSAPQKGLILSFDEWINLAVLGWVLLVMGSVFIGSFSYIHNPSTCTQKQLVINECKDGRQKGQKNGRNSFRSRLCIHPETDSMPNLPTRNNPEKRDLTWLEMIIFPNTP